MSKQLEKNANEHLAWARKHYSSAFQKDDNMEKEYWELAIKLMVDSKKVNGFGRN